MSQRGSIPGGCWTMIQNALPVLPSFGMSVSSDSADVTMECLAIGRTLGTEGKIGHVSVLKEVMGRWGRQICQQHIPSYLQRARVEVTAVAAMP